jgi:type I restriction enzyme S subunit
MQATATKDQIRRFELREGDVLVTKDSETWDDIAVPAVVTEDLDEILCGYHLAMIRPGRDVDGNFLSRAFAAVGPRDQFHIAANGITRYGLGGSAIRDGLFALPPLAEQKQIAKFIDNATATVDALINSIEEGIDHLQEYRTALISAAVTGKIDVRAA